MDEMSYFLMGVSDELVREYLSAMIHDNMNISHLILHAQKVEEIRLRIKSREAMKAK